MPRVLAMSPYDILSWSVRMISLSKQGTCGGSCLLFNFNFSGTFISGTTVYCCAKVRPKGAKKIRVLRTNSWVALVQFLTTFMVLLGWIWSIMWGVSFLSISGEPIMHLWVYPKLCSITDYLLFWLQCYRPLLAIIDYYLLCNIIHPTTDNQTTEYEEIISSLKCSELFHRHINATWSPLMSHGSMSGKMLGNSSPCLVYTCKGIQLSCFPQER